MIAWELPWEACPYLTSDIFSKPLLQSLDIQVVPCRYLQNHLLPLHHLQSRFLSEPSILDRDQQPETVQSVLWHGEACMSNQKESPSAIIVSLCQRGTQHKLTCKHTAWRRLIRDCASGPRREMTSLYLPPSVTMMAKCAHSPMTSTLRSFFRLSECELGHDWKNSSEVMRPVTTHERHTSKPCWKKSKR